MNIDRRSRKAAIRSLWEKEGKQEKTSPVWHDGIPTESGEYLARMTVTQEGENHVRIRITAWQKLEDE